MRPELKTGILGLAAALAPATAFAHTGVGDTGGLMHGFMHPIGGARPRARHGGGRRAGRLARRQGAVAGAGGVRAMMAAGGVLGIGGIERAVRRSRHRRLGGRARPRGGAAASACRRLRAMGLAGFFAVFHGYAHGAEMPATASGLDYALGFMLATALLHARRHRARPRRGAHRRHARGWLCRPAAARWLRQALRCSPGISEIALRLPLREGGREAAGWGCWRR